MVIGVDESATNFLSLHQCQASSLSHHRMKRVHWCSSSPTTGLISWLPSSSYRLSSCTFLWRSTKHVSWDNNSKQLGRKKMGMMMKRLALVTREEVEEVPRSVKEVKEVNLRVVRANARNRGRNRLEVRGIVKGTRTICFSIKIDCSSSRFSFLITFFFFLLLQWLVSINNISEFGEPLSPTMNVCVRAPKYIFLLSFMALKIDTQVLPGKFSKSAAALEARCSSLPFLGAAVTDHHQATHWMT